MRVTDDLTKNHNEERKSVTRTHRKCKTMSNFMTPTYASNQKEKEKKVKSIADKIY